MKRFVVLGSNFAGINAALLLKRRFPKDDITIIDKNESFEYYPSMYKILTTPSAESKLKINLKELYSKKRIDFICSEIISIDINANKVKTTNYEYEYDYLINCLGAVTTYYGISGAKEHSLPFKSINEMKQIKEKILDLTRGGVSEKKILVVGSGLSGIELTFEIKNYLRAYNKDNIKITIIEAKDRIVPWSNQKTTDYVMQKALKDGIDLKTNFLIKSVESNKIVNDKDEDITFDLLLWCAGVTTNPLIKDAGLQTDNAGMIVDDYLRSVTKPNVYACGDAISYKVNDKQLLKNGHHTLTTSAYVVKTLYSTINEKPLKKFDTMNNTPALIDLRHHGVIMTYKEEVYTKPIFFYGLVKKGIQNWWIFTRKKMM